MPLYKISATAIVHFQKEIIVSADNEELAKQKASGYTISFGNVWIDDAEYESAEIDSLEIISSKEAEELVGGTSKEIEKYFGEDDDRCIQLDERDDNFYDFLDELEEEDK